MLSADDQGGFTLVELLVVIAIVAVVGAITLTTLVRGMQVGARADERIAGFSELQRASERVSRDLRRAVWTDVSGSTWVEPPGCTVLELDPQDITIIVFEGTDRFRHRYVVADGTMTLTRESWSGSAWETPTTQVVIDGLENDPVFSYLDEDGTDLLADGGIQPEDRGDVRKFGLRLAAELRDGSEIEVQTVVGARNGGRECPTT